MLIAFSISSSDNLFFCVEREKTINIIPDEGLQVNNREDRINSVVSLLESQPSTNAEEDLERHLSKSFWQNIAFL